MKKSVMKIIISALILVILVIVGFFIFFSHPASSSLTSEAQLESLVRLAADRQELIADQAEQLLAVLSKVPEVTGSDAVACHTVLANVLANQDRFLNFGVIKPNGDLFCAGVMPTSTAPFNVSSTVYFQNAMADGGFAVGDYRVGLITAQPTFTFAYAYKDAKGKILGIMTTGVDLSWLRNFSRLADLPAGAQMIITDNKGVVLERYPDNSVGMEAPEIDFSPVKIIDLQSGLGYEQVKNAQGEDFDIIVAPVRIPDENGFLHIILSIPSDDVTK